MITAAAGHGRVVVDGQAGFLQKLRLVAVMVDRRHLIIRVQRSSITVPQGEVLSDAQERRRGVAAINLAATNYFLGLIRARARPSSMVENDCP